MRNTAKLLVRINVMIILVLSVKMNNICTQIQSVFQRARIPRLAHARGPNAHQFTVAQSTATRYPETTR